MGKEEVAVGICPLVINQFWVINLYRLCINSIIMLSSRKGGFKACSRVLYVM